MKLSDTFDWIEGAKVTSDPVVAVDAAEIDDDEADGPGLPPSPPPAPAPPPAKSDMSVVDDDLIESSTDAADDETDLYMDSNFDEMLSSLSEFVLHVRSFDARFLCLGCFDIADAIF